MAILSDAYLTLGPLASMQIDAAKAAEGFSGDCRFDWGDGTDIPCTAKPLKIGSELDIGGWREMKHVKIAVRVEEISEFDAYPKAKDKITLYLSENGPAYELRILNVENSNDALLFIECVDSSHPGL